MSYLAYSGKSFHFSSCAFALIHLEKAGLVRMEHFEDVYERDEPIPLEVQKEIAKHFKNPQITRLGKGNYGIVFRASSEGKHLDVKYYFEKEIEQARADAIAFNVLREHVSPQSVQIPKTIASTNNMLVLESNFGIPLNEYFSNRELPIEFRASAHQKYKNAIDELDRGLSKWSKAKGLEEVEQIRSNTFFQSGFEFKNYSKIFIDPISGELFKFLFKPNNFIMTPTGELILIDPY